MSRNDRTSQGRRRIALSLGTAAGASLAAAFISMGTAHAIIGGDSDPFEDVLGATNGGPLDTFVTTLDPTFAVNLDALYDGFSTTDADPFTDMLGATGAPIDSLLGAQVGGILDLFVDQINTADATPFTDLLGATAGAPIDALLGVTLGADLDPFVDLFLPAM
jgi:hypothetical protein